MDIFGLSVPVIYQPELDPDFIPFQAFRKAFLRDACKPVSLALERGDGAVSVHRTFIHGTPEMAQVDRFYMDRLVKFLLWMKGGFRIYISGDRAMYDYICELYREGGKQHFEWDFMQTVYERPFEVLYVDALPEEREFPKRIGGHFEGCRIGFDAGGSDRKVSAVIDGETVYSEEVVWFPKITEDIQYHYDGIVSALKTAAAHMPRVDAVGVSAAGVYINDRTMCASLFLKVPKEQYEEKVKNIFIQTITDTFGDVPYSVVNDGDVTALAGAISLEENNVLGIAMGTGEAVGYVDAQGCVTGWLNEVCFAPVDVSEKAAWDDWSLDVGPGCKYFSQDAVIRLAQSGGIALEESLSPAEKLKVVQSAMAEGDPRAAAVYRSMGTYLAHTLALYCDFYGYRHALLLGRVMSGKGGDLLLETCKEVLAGEYPEMAQKIRLALPNEKFRRVGQSAAAASLPEIH